MTNVCICACVYARAYVIYMYKHWSLRNIILLTKRYHFYYLIEN